MLAGHDVLDVVREFDVILMDTAVLARSPARAQTSALAGIHQAVPLASDRLGFELEDGEQVRCFDVAQVLITLLGGELTLIGTLGQHLDPWPVSGSMECPEYCGLPPC